MKKRNHQLTRREFFAKGAAGVAAVGLIGKRKDEAAVAKSSGFISQTHQVPKMIYRTLGKTGIRLPIVNMGVMNATNADLVKRSYELGVR
ncbi:MAG: hypothetical protein JXE07_03540, partial [Candidatus Aminicenantes bacterium]|nr:hypothetical protein [Candidatus Aminicenantes bacterium]